MVTSTSLQQQMADKINEISQAVSGITDEQALLAPAQGEWCVKEVLSHLIGDERSFATDIQRIIDEDTPLLEVQPGISFYDDARAGQPVAELLQRVQSLYGQIGDSFGGLTDEQLSRKAHVPLLKETPIGEYPTLGQWAMALMNYHLAAHVKQLQDLRAGL